MFTVGQQKIEISVKNNGQSTEHRKLGNKLFAQKKWREAMESYNKSLCYAENNSENVALVYSNRSACFFHMRMYEKCLTDIKLAESAKYPEGLKSKLEKRKADCRQLIQNGDQFVPLEPALSFEPNEKFPSMANILKIECNKKYGRHITTNTEIDVGQTVLLERAYFTKLLINKSMRCNICLKTDTNLVPCLNCTVDLFCYGKCERNELHRFECNIFTIGGFGDVSDLHMQVFRSILIALNEFQDVDDLMKFVEETLASDPTEIPEYEPTDPKEKYRTYLKLSSRTNMETDYIIWRIYFIQKTLLKNPEIAVKFKTEQHQRFLMHLVGHHHGILMSSARASIETYGRK